MIEIHHVLYLLGAAVIALLVSLFLYFKKGKKQQFISLAILRFISVFTILVLLLNFQFTSKTYDTILPTLSVLVDNSSSIKTLNFDKKAQQFLEEISEDKDLHNKFSVETYSFSSDLSNHDSLDFTGYQTNITKAIQALERVHRNTNNAIVLLSDGNQTFGADYQYASKGFKAPVFPLVLGDSTTYVDLKISQLNVNKYAYFKNKFPIEIFITAEGNTDVNSVVKIFNGSQLLFSEKVSFSPENTSAIINTELFADKIGIQTLKVVVEPISEEKNTENNTKFFAIEVIDQKSKIAIVTDVRHPDIGALKQTIESNEFRTATIVDVRDFKGLQDYQLFILYQPTTAFKAVIEQLKSQQQNYWIVTGLDTNWQFLNAMELGFTYNSEGGVEDFLPAFNPNFQTFSTEDINFSAFPPLEESLGTLSFFEENQDLLFKRIGAINTDESLLTTFENGEQKAAILLGEGIWKWRAASFLANESNEAFDTYFGKLLQYLSSKKRRERLTVNYESFYDGSKAVKIQASFFDKNYELNKNASLEISVKNKNTTTSKTFPMLYSGNMYEVDLNSLAAGDYEFTVSVPAENIKASGNFTILKYDVEQQFVNPDVKRLQILADNTSGTMFYYHDFLELKEQLLADDRFQTVQKEKLTKEPLIDWQWLLGILVLSLSVEWFLRKYYGLI
ncbi:vWA domain-containing protein [Joostella sp. CR20]|uniref:vWA domain-containing protein n=1 Tax=Joostella sp. CR20 TaxID=2804312 RepID=UPI00313D199E